MRRLTSFSMGRNVRPLVVAGVALLLVVGTAFAANPSQTPASPIPAASHAAPTASVAPMAPETPTLPKASKTPEAPDASEAPEAPDEAEAPDASPATAEISRVVANLSAVGIKTTAADVQALAAKVGLGGAVRVLAFAHASGKSPAQILAMFQGGTGWGAIGHSLNLSIGPGLGWIMGHGHKGGSH